MIGGFRSVLCVSVFQGSLLVIVIMIDSSEKRNCEGSFWVRAHFGQSNFSFFQQKRKQEILLILVIFTYFKEQTKIEKKKMVRKIDNFLIFLILKSAPKIQKILQTAKSDILLFFIFLLWLENEKNEIIPDY